MQSKLVAESAGQRIFVIILEPGEEAFSTFDFAVKEQFSAASLTALGAFSDAGKTYRRIPLAQQCEVPSALGDIAIDDSGKPSLHVHVVLGLSDGSIRGGHLLEGFVRPTLEVSLVETPARSAGCGRTRTRRRATRRWGSCPGYAGLRLLSTLPGPRLRLPGRKAGLSRGRDLSRLHPCSGYATDPSGEIQVGGFTGGYKKHNPIFVILFVILTFSAVMNMTPLEQPTLRGIFATEGLADNFLLRSSAAATPHRPIRSVGPLRLGREAARGSAHRAQNRAPSGMNTRQVACLKACPLPSPRLLPRIRMRGCIS